MKGGTLEGYGRYEEMNQSGRAWAMVGGAVLVRALY